MRLVSSWVMTGFNHPGLHLPPNPECFALRLISSPFTLPIYTTALCNWLDIMADREQLAILRQGVDAWNRWRNENPGEKVDLQIAYLEEAHLKGANLWHANLQGTNLERADLGEANLVGAYLFNTDFFGAKLDRAKLGSANLNYANLNWADLRGADLYMADLRDADLYMADLSEANLRWANLTKADLRGAKLIGADLNSATLIETALDRADLTGCKIYGVSAWGLKLDDATKQRDLVITPPGESVITIDDLEVAQFVYFLLYNSNLRRIIDTMTSKVVLILGRFASDRKPTLDAIKDELRKRGYVPVIFDFEKSAKRTTEETITLIARLARFVIADITDPKSIIQEISCIVKELPSVPIKPILLAGDQHKPWGMYDHIQDYPWLLEIHRYKDTAELITSFEEGVLGPIEGWIEEHPRLGSK